MKLSQYDKDVVDFEDPPFWASILILAVIFGIAVTLGVLFLISV